jgi:hypothetical protein
MKKTLIIILLGLVVAAAGYCTLYYCGTRQHREMMSSHTPELAWLKKEFHLNDAEFDRISKLHEGYMPRCEDLCRRIAAKNAEVRQLTTASNTSAPLIEQKLKESAELRVECQKHMLDHFIKVSQQMPPEQGKRYLEWVQQRTLAPDHDMMIRHGKTKHSVH